MVVEFLEKIFGKEGMAEMPARDPDLSCLLEVADEKIKEGLKMYENNSHMDDAE